MSIDPSILTKIIAVEVNKDPGTCVDSRGRKRLVLLRVHIGELKITSYASSVSQPLPYCGDAESEFEFE